jgi:hypothetical protein
MDEYPTCTTGRFNIHWLHPRVMFSASPRVPSVDAEALM